MQCVDEGRWKISNDWPPVRTRLQAQPDPKTSSTQEWTPTAIGDGWVIHATPKNPIVIERDSHVSVKIPTKHRVWRLSADAQGQTLAWLEEDDVLRFRNAAGIVGTVAEDISHTTSLLVTEDGRSIFAGVDQAFGVFNAR